MLVLSLLLIVATTVSGPSEAPASGDPRVCGGSAGPCDCVDLRLPESISCNLNADCELPVTLLSNGLEVASAAGQLTSHIGLSCGDTCRGGAATAGAQCFVQSATCTFNVVDLIPPISPFADGEAAVVTLRCTNDGAGFLCLQNQSAGSPLGVPVAVCEDAVCAPIFCGNPQGGLGCGDANGDGRITATDALIALRQSVGIDAGCVPAICDVNGDGRTSTSDALIVLRVSVAPDDAVLLVCP